MSSKRRVKNNLIRETLYADTYTPANDKNAWKKNKNRRTRVMGAQKMMRTKG